MLMFSVVKLSKKEPETITFLSTLAHSYQLPKGGAVREFATNFESLKYMCWLLEDC